jgi:quercetin dioxygenase-like cupin family protein
MSGEALVVKAGEGEALSVIGAEVRFLCRAADTGKAWSLMETRIPKGMGPTPHHHPWDEAYYVIAGELDFQVGDRAERVRAGDFLYAPGGTVHAFHGASEEPARLLIFDAPAHAEMFFKELEREVRQLPDDLRKMPAIGERHHVTFLPQAAAE